MNLIDYFRLFFNNKNLIIFLQNYNLLAKERYCKKCGKKMSLIFEKFLFKCYNRIENNSKKKKVKPKRCNTQISIRTGTVFASSHLQINVLFLFIVYFFTFSPTIQFLHEQIGISKKTVIKYMRLIRVNLTLINNRHHRKLGGKNRIVQIDEAHFSGRYKKVGRISTGYWVIGAHYKVNNRIYVQVIPDRSEKSIIPFVKRHIKKDTTIYTDCWKGYSKLNSVGYSHLEVNHTKGFVEPKTKCNTQAIERQWRELRRVIPKHGNYRHYTNLYSNEFMYRHNFMKFNLVKLYFKELGIMYPATTN